MKRKLQVVVFVLLLIGAAVLAVGTFNPKDEFIDNITSRCYTVPEPFIHMVCNNE